MAQTVAQLGKLNIVVSNAAEQFTSTDVAELPNEQFEDIFQVIFCARSGGESRRAAAARGRLHHRYLAYQRGPGQ